MYIEKHYFLPSHQNKKRKEEYSITEFVIDNIYVKVMYKLSPKRFFRVLSRAECPLKYNLN